MARTIGKLSALAVSRIKEKGLYSDGGGLYLRVKDTGGKFWVFRFMLHGKAREMGIGALHALTTADARVKAADCRRLLAEGKDPIDFREAVQSQRKLAAAKVKIFKECAEAYIAAHEKGWRNAKHVQQWKNTLDTYANPVIGDLSVQDVDLALVTKILEQKSKAFGKGETLWTARPETAARLRGRLEVILDWATTREYRSGENPARWRGHLENLLPKRSKFQRTKHQPSLPYEQIGDFMAELREQDGTAPQALAFTILTGARSGETLGAVWDEIDFDKAVWTVPAVRTKTDRDHRVALSQDAVSILKLMQKEQKTSGANNKFIFAGRKGRQLSDMAMLVLIRRMNEKDKKPKWVDPRQANKPVVPHGFRSTFRDWAAEQTNFPREIAEAALSHISGDKVELTYRRTDFFDKRRQMMEAWARYCVTHSKKHLTDNVTPLKRTAR